MEIIKTSQPMNDAARNHLLYNGNVLIFEQLPAILELNAYLNRLVESTFEEIIGDLDFNKAVNTQHNADFNSQIEQLQKCFSEESRFTALFRW